ncbi:hypothetical protein ANN_14243 [Periplaneta americana]|uniref:Uncharacterized protein n=1 Tax=Periplaneta americana TaxID=6978 RepID=A0ABQ8SWV1_PERAM|nr:hypothetical protein ANN_14243 [Periplaneta americana]
MVMMKMIMVDDDYDDDDDGEDEDNYYPRLRWVGHVAHMGESRNAYRVLVGRSEEKSPLGRPRCRWEDNIKMDLREVGCDDRYCINLAQDRDLCEGGNEPPGSLKAIFGRTAIQFSLFQNYEMPEFTNREYLDMIQAAEEIRNSEELIRHNWTRRYESCMHADGGHFE